MFSHNNSLICWNSFKTLIALAASPVLWQQQRFCSLSWLETSFTTSYVEWISVGEERVETFSSQFVLRQHGEGVVTVEGGFEYEPFFS